MLGFVQNIFAPGVSPIGIDFGTDTLRLSQVQFDGNDFQLIAASTAQIPIAIRQNIPQRLDFFSQTVSDLLSQGKFRGRRAVLGLPSAWTLVRNFRSANVDTDAMKAALPADWSSEFADLHTRHIVAGELKHADRSEWEVILIAARKSLVDSLLVSAHRARLDVRGLTVEMCAMVDCFAHVYRRKADANSTSCYLDIGSQGSRIVVARGGRIVFMRNSATGGDELNAAVATRLKLHADDARLLRQKLSHAQTGAAERPARGTEAAGEEKGDAGADPLYIDQDTGIAVRVEKAVRGPLYAIVEQVERCRQDHDEIFPAAPIDRIVLCGGEARNRLVSKYISSAMNIATQVGDPMVRLSKSAQAGIGIDRRQPQPMWAVSLGLTMGPAQVQTQLPATVAPIAPAVSAGREAA